MARLPHVLISNDDGVNAPGLRAIVAAVTKAGFCNVSVCGPVEEQSAKSHSLTLRKVMVVTRIEVDGVADAYAMHGTPADSIMLAVNSNLLSDKKIDLVVSGINNGDNCGYHVVYSGTVGAAREAAIKGIPAIAISLCYHAARTTAQFEEAASFSLPLIKGMLGLHSISKMPTPDVVGYVMNVNFPESTTFQGYYWTSQGRYCIYTQYTEVSSGDDASRMLRKAGSSHIKDYEEVLKLPGTREFVGEFKFHKDGSEGSDMHEVNNGFISVTPLKIFTDLRDLGAADYAAEAAMAEVVQYAGREVGLQVVGVPSKYAAPAAS